MCEGFHDLFYRNVVREIIKTDGIFGSSGLLGILIQRNYRLILFGYFNDGINFTNKGLPS